MSNTLQVDSVIFDYGMHIVLSGPFLQCKTNETVGILGRNGSGKTTLLRIIFGELQTADKSIRINNEAIYEAYKKMGMINYLPQFNFLPKAISIKNIFKHFEADSSDFIEFFGEFEKYYRNRINKLSGGEKRILEVYLILTAKSKFCLLDEPFSQIMPVHVEIVKSLIKREKQKKGIVLVDHYYNDILDVSDKLVVLFNGQTKLVEGKSDLRRLGYIN